MYLSIVLPLHNEERRLPPALEALDQWILRQPWQVEVLAVLNGCTDNTLRVVRAERSKYRYLRILELPQRGKGGAVRRGMLEAAGQYRYMCDVDLATPPEVIGQFIQHAKSRSDVVIGMRRRENDTPLRALSGRVFGALAAALVPGIPDTQCGFKLFNTRAAEQIFSRAQLDGMAFDVEALYIARQLALRVFSLPVPWKHDRDSRVRIVRDSAQMARDLLRIYALHHHIQPQRYLYDPGA